MKFFNFICLLVQLMVLGELVSEWLSIVLNSVVYWIVSWDGSGTFFLFFCGIFQAIKLIDLIPQRLRPNENLRNPWFRDYWQKLTGCLDRNSSGWQPFRCGQLWLDVFFSFFSLAGKLDGIARW